MNHDRVKPWEWAILALCLIPLIGIIALGLLANSGV